MNTAAPNAVVTRFAPSPTGYLHVGGARTALFSWLLARHTGGKFLLRIEDTDLERSTEESARGLLEDLRWLGLHWDNEEIVYQSRRLEVYNGIIADLMARGLAYKAYETPAELTAQRQAAERAKRAYIYKRPTLTDEQVRRFEAQGRPHVVRFAMPVKSYSFHDVVLEKDIAVAPNQVQDFVIRKTDGMPTYHFAVVVDDAEMKITHVLRGQEHLLNTINHIALQEALGYARPIYGHLSVILNIDGSRMSKRDQDKKIRHHANLWVRAKGAPPALTGVLPEKFAEWLKSDTRQLAPTEQEEVMQAIGMSPADLPEILVHDFRASGYFPEVLLNFLALLGWSPGGDRERMSLQEMIELFSLEGVGKSNAKFSRDKLLAFNTEAASSATPQRLVQSLRDYLAVHPDSPLGTADDAALQRVLSMNAGFHVLREVDEKSRFLFVADGALTYDAGAIDKILLKNDGQGLMALRDALPVLETAEPWNAASLELALQGLCERKQLGLGKVAQPIRVAVSGTAVSPPIFETLDYLGREHTLARVRRCLEMIH